MQILILFIFVAVAHGGVLEDELASLRKDVDLLQMYTDSLKIELKKTEARINMRDLDINSAAATDTRAFYVHGDAQPYAYNATVQFSDVYVDVGNSWSAAANNWLCPDDELYLITATVRLEQGNQGRFVVLFNDDLIYNPATNYPGGLFLDVTQNAKKATHTTLVECTPLGTIAMKRWEAGPVGVAAEAEMSGFRISNDP